MAFISSSQHNSFLSSLDNSIKKFEEQNHKHHHSVAPVTELKNNLAVLDHIYSECEAMTERLRTLIGQYQKIQKRTRITLRVCQLKHLK